MREVGGDWQTLTNATYPHGLWSCGRWERASLDLSPYAGKEVQLGFLFHSQINSDGRSYVAEGWYLDDLEIVSGPMVFQNPQGFEAPDFWDHWYCRQRRLGSRSAHRDFQPSAMMARRPRERSSTGSTAMRITGGTAG